MKEFFLESGADEQTEAEGLREPEIRRALAGLLESIRAEKGPLKKVLILPPDSTRIHSGAGGLTALLCRLLPDTEIEIMPALGTHAPMTGEEIQRMYPGIPASCFRVHDWRRDVRTIGEVPGREVSKLSEGAIQTGIPVEVNKALLDPSFDLILSVGQVVPHEVVGMSNYNKNIFVGCGGSGMINASHFLGAVYGMERVMGRDHSPVHRLFDYAEARFAGALPLCYLLTVMEKGSEGMVMRSLSGGRSRQLFERSIQVSQARNLTRLPRPIRKAVVYLEPEEFRSTWVGNKAIYRTRMAIADGGSLLILAPGVDRFGEDPENDRLIRKYGYCGRDRVRRAIQEDPALQNNLGAAAHLIHGSTEGRFSVTYAPGGLCREEVEQAGFSYASLPELLAHYPADRLREGFQTIEGEEIFYISNPALGLWHLGL